MGTDHVTGRHFQSFISKVILLDWMGNLV